MVPCFHPWLWPEPLARFLDAIPSERLGTAPASRSGFAPLGGWSAHRHLFHLVHYERHFALPALQVAVQGATPGRTWPDEEQAYRPELPPAELLEQLRMLRRDQAQLVLQARDGDLEKPAAPWQRSTRWTVAKTIQHTAEHTNDIARLALFWEFSSRLAETIESPLAGVARRWLSTLQECVRAQDYRRARDLFGAEVVGYGTRAEVAVGLEALEREQWRQVWPRIRGFTFRLEEVRCYGDDTALCIMVPWDSQGTEGDGATSSRRGRATLILAPAGGHWRAVHSHFSLVPRPPA
jgi:ketosteroid isomerase-like protein/uncharacterized damage-inducible protein DinB